MKEIIYDNTSEELMLTIENENGLAISNEYDISTRKLMLNGIEITDEDSWNKAIVSLNELEKENEELEERINKAIEYIEKKWYSKCTINISDVVSFGDWHLDLLKILKGED